MVSFTPLETGFAPFYKGAGDKCCSALSLLSVPKYLQRENEQCVWFLTAPDLQMEFDHQWNWSVSVLALCSALGGLSDEILLNS